jgi:hypothetical protein
MRVFLGFVSYAITSLLNTSCAHTTPVADVSKVISKDPRLFRCSGQFDIESREIRGFVDVNGSVTYFQGWAYQGGQAFERLRKQKLVPQNEVGKQLVYDASSSLGELRFTLPNEVYVLEPNSGWENSTVSRFSSNLTYSLPSSPESKVTVPMKCSMWKPQDYAANAYDEAFDGREVTL